MPRLDRNAEQSFPTAPQMGSLLLSDPQQGSFLVRVAVYFLIRLLLPVQSEGGGQYRWNSLLPAKRP
jgi:hypothetical protein